MAFPDRAWICLDCRMALTAQQCPAGHERVVSLFHMNTLIDEVWGPPRLRERLLEAGKVGTAGGGAWSLLDGCGDLIDVSLGEVLIVVFVFAVVWLVAREIVRFVRGRLRRRQARGASKKLAPIARTGQLGTIRATTTDRIPGLGEGVAFAAEYDLLGSRMLHDSATVGFEVELDTGERVAVPAGSALIALDGAPAVGIAPLVYSWKDGPFDPFVHTRVRGLVLAPGDRVEVCSPLQAVPDANTGYREVGRRRIPCGVIRLRPC